MIPISTVPDRYGNALTLDSIQYYLSKSVLLTKATSCFLSVSPPVPKRIMVKCGYLIE